MQESTTGQGTGSATIADIVGLAAEVAAVRDRLPKLEDVLSIDDFGALRERGRTRDAAELAERVAAVTPEDPYTIIYTSGTTGPPKGCVLTHDNYRQVTRMCEEI